MIKKYIVRFAKIAVYYLNGIIPKNKNQIFLSSSFEYKDNIAALVEELLKNNSTQQFKIILDGKGLTDYQGINIYHVKHKSLQSVWNFLRSQYVIYDNGLYGSKKVNKQLSVNVWHGMPIKRIGNYIDHEKGTYKDTATHVIAISEFYRDIMANAFGINQRDVLIANEPRNDFLFNREKILDTLGINEIEYKNTIIWMATYRTSKVADTGNDSVNYEYGVPLLNKDNIFGLDDFLIKERSLLVIKHHSLQDVPIAVDTLKNIKFITSDDIAKTNKPLYSLLANFDALITDYSSVFLNYLILNKPICFAYDDYDIYSGKRGFLFDDLENLMPGFKANRFEQLLEFIDDISRGVDFFEKERAIANKKFNVYNDDRNAQRLLEKIGILDKSLD